MDSELLNVLILINNENNLVSLGRDCHLIQDMRDLLLARGLVVTESLYTIAPK
jgi:predicted HAD superfamily hydrolase